MSKAIVDLLALARANLFQAQSSLPSNHELTTYDQAIAVAQVRATCALAEATVASVEQQASDAKHLIDVLRGIRGAM